MEIFSEIYGLYYRIAEDILNRAPLSRAEAQRIASHMGFAESMMALVPKLLEGQAWPLLEERDGMLYSRLRHPVRVPVSLLELQWLKAVLCDPRARLFLSDREIIRLENLLFDVPPLFDPEDFIPFDRCRDGDDYYSHDYILHFRRILTAMRAREAVRITYQTGVHSGGVRVHMGDFIPLKLEYSEKDDKFRAYCAYVPSKSPARIVTINLGRILKTSCLPATFQDAPRTLESWIFHNRSQEPVVADVFPERNAVERFLLEFSSYEKQSEFDGDTGICRVRLWYPLPDETELLIRILGFGPTVKVLGPKRFVRQIKTRVAAQAQLLKQMEAEKREKQ